MDAILDLAGRHDLVVIEDAAQAHGTEYREKRLGATGQMGCFSFQASKNLTAGEGGAILTNGEHYDRVCRSLHTCGRYPESAWYEHFLPGGNYRMTEFQAALLINQLENLEAQTTTRDQNGRYLNTQLDDIPGIDPLVLSPEVTRHAFHLYIFRFRQEEFDGLTRSRFLEALEAEGIPNSKGYGLPLYQQEVFAGLEFGPYSGYRHTNPELDYLMNIGK